MFKMLKAGERATLSSCPVLYLTHRIADSRTLPKVRYLIQRKRPLPKVDTSTITPCTSTRYSHTKHKPSNIFSFILDPFVDNLARTPPNRQVSIQAQFSLVSRTCLVPTQQLAASPINLHTFISIFTVIPSLALPSSSLPPSHLLRTSKTQDQTTRIGNNRQLLEYRHSIHQ